MRCPEPEALAQLGAGTLAAEERGALLDHAASCAECHAVVAVLGQEPAAVGTPELAVTRIDRYELRRVVGRGAMGVVYAAFDPELDREVAVKVLRPSMSPQRLRREAQALARLAHPNVVRVYDVGDHDGQTFIAMELVDGVNLREWSRDPHALDEIIALLVEAGRGLAAAHAAGLVHRDFKPDNVLVARSGNVLVGDFGLARSTAPSSTSSEDGPTATAVSVTSSESLTATGAVVGTPAYMAPEQASGEATAASDQYAFCVTAWEACFGERPGTGAVVPRSVPKRIEQTLRRGLASHASERFADMPALLRALAPPPRRRWPWLAGGALALAATTTTAVLVTRSTGTAIDCDEAGASIAPVWSADVEAQLMKRWNASVANGFAQYAASWRAHRIAACRATHVRHEQTVETLERQVACLDRARATLRTTIEVLLHSEALPRPDGALEGLPSLARCEGAPPIVAASSPALEQELVELDVSLLAGAPSVSAAAASELRSKAEALGDRALTLRAMLLEARVASWNGDAVAAEAILRRAMNAADHAGDDFTRAHAGALLALIVAGDRVAEATALIESARAALVRAGDDPAIEQALLEAEVAIASSRGDHRGAVAAQERIVTSVRERFGDRSPILAHAYSRLNVLWAAAGDISKAMAAQRHALDIAESTGESLGTKASILDLVATGDFEGAAEVGRRQLAYMRALPAHSLKVEAYTASQLALALELDGRYGEALDAYREAEALWSRPAAEFATVGEELDPPAILGGIVDAVYSQGASLLTLGRVDEAVTTLTRARGLALGGGAATASAISGTTRWLAQALVVAGRFREARDLLEPIAEQLGTDPGLKPLPRAMAMFALAQALWSDGGLEDRPRALALVSDAEHYLGLAIADGNANAYLRKLPPLARAEQGRIARWKATHRMQ